MRGWRETAMEASANLRKRLRVALRWSLVVALLLGCLPALYAQGGTAPSFTTLYNFCAQIGTCPDGGYPLTGLVQGADGDFYGTTQTGGSSEGTVFKITPSGALTTLWSFCVTSQIANCPGGYDPYGPLVQGTDGNFYGVTRNGGPAPGYGTVFQITPAGVLTTIYSFCSLSTCSDGAYPEAGLTLGSDGNFYGTTIGYSGGGTVFKVTPGGALTTLYTFCALQGCTDGSGPMGPPIEGTDGNFYGTTSGGGTSGNGVVYKLTPSGTLTVLYSFCSQAGCLDGAQPQGSLIQATDGNFYGTTLNGGLNVNGGNNGTIFKITPGGALTTLYLFCSVLVQGECNDGTQPGAGLIQGTDGNFYGTTESGGTGADGGTVYKITPAGAQTVLYSFCSQGGGSQCTDGYKPQGSLVEGSDGNLYGTTTGYGAYGQGTVFRVNAALTTILVPNVVGQTQAAATTAIKTAGLTVGTITLEASTTVAAGDVISQSPAAGTGVGAGTAVALVVSSGPPPPPAPIALAFSPSTATSAVSVTATATIMPIATPVTGTVNFTASFNNTLTTLCAQAPVASVSASWQATCTFTEDIPGTYTITAVYSGDALNGGNTSSAVLTVNQGLIPVLTNVANSRNALAINANNSPGLQFNAVLNNDSSVSLLVNGSILAGQGCPAFAGLSSGLAAGAVYVDFANSIIYLAMFSYNSGLYAAYESINQAGACTQGPLLQLSATGLGSPAVELNVDTAQGNMYVLSANGGGLPDPLYLLPTAPWSATSLPVPVQLTLDYSAQYGPIEIDPSNHMVYINDLGGSAYGQAGTYATAGFFVYSPTQSATPANNLQHVVGYISGGATTPFNVATLLTNGAGKVVLANENPSASTTSLAVPLTILDTTQFSFFSNTQTVSSGGVNITPGAGLSTIPAVTQYSALGGADIDAPNSVVYAYGFNDSNSSQPGILLDYNLLNPPASAETVLSNNIPAPVNYNSTLAWSQLNYDPVSTEMVLSVPSLSSGTLGMTSPLCDGSPTLTQLVGNSASPSPINPPVVNTASGYVYAVEGASLGTSPQSPGIVSVAPPPAGCGQTPPIHISPATLPPGAVASAYSQTLTASGGSGTGYTWTVQSGTALSATGLTLSSAGVISGTPTQAEAAAPVTVQATDSAGNTGTQSYQLTIYPTLGIVGAPPAGPLGVPYSYTFTGTGGSGSGYTFSVTTGATALTALGMSLSSSGTLSGTPTATGSTNFTLQVTDSAGDTAVRPYALTITSVLIIAPASLPAGTAGTAYSASLTATGGSGTGYTWSVSAGAASLTALGLSLSSTGILNGTPTAAGQAAFTAQVTDSFGEIATQAYTLVINAAVSGPVNVNDPETITVNDSQTSVQIIDATDPETIKVTDTVSVWTITPTTTTLTISPSSASAGQPVTFTATVAPTMGSGTPTGSVTISCTNSASNQSVTSGPIALAGGSAVWTTASVPAGVYTNCFTAAYSGDTSFASSTSAAQSLTVTDFQIHLSAPPVLVLWPGHTVTFSFTVAPVAGAFNGTVSFTMTGLPPGVTATSNPPSVIPGNNPTTVTVTLSAIGLAQAEEPRGTAGSAAPLLFALVLPLLGLGRVRRRIREGGWRMLVVLFLLIGVAGLSSCGTASGFFNQSPQTYTVTLTATSGTAQHSTPISLTVE